MYENTFNQISKNLAEITILLDKDFLSEECEELTVLLEATEELFKEFDYLHDLGNDPDYTLNKEERRDFYKYRKLDKEFENLKTQINPEEESCEDIIEATLDSMFPNRHDSDFDEDDMSYDQVFGDD